MPAQKILKGETALEVQLTLKNEGFEAENSAGTVVKLGGGMKDAVSPMEALLMAAGACSGLDVVAILKKMRQPLEGLRVEVLGQRRDDYPKSFEELVIRYFFRGDLEEEKVQRAIELSLGKYCSVTNGLQPKADVRYEYQIEKRGDEN